jgi:hypothetical protein
MTEDDKYAFKENVLEALNNRDKFNGLEDK